ncbi:hypothetical protein QM071_24765 [Escherichia coli]|uniref:hypothetical protein n=1 Tax=Escherichia coli TaxID=562 RepID=UPI00294A0480|nr:hypothetical protein [Escherichia coli]MDV5495393.1 hypothetical protein [Escherichia coli]
MSKKKLILTGALLSLFALVGCKPTDEKAITLGQQAIADDMKDPTSVMFRKDKFVRTDHDDGSVTGFVCGELNAKNGFGAYVGYHSYVVELEMKPKGMFSKGWYTKSYRSRWHLMILMIYSVISRSTERCATVRL